MESAYRTFVPSQLLQPYVHRFWEYDSSNERSRFAGVRKVMPDASINLIINIEHFSWIDRGNNWEKTPNALVQGVVTRSYLLQSEGRTHAFGIHFKPEGLLELFGAPQQELIDQFQDPGDFLDTRTRPFVSAIQHARSAAERIRLAEVFLLDRLRHNKHPKPYLGEALRLIRREHGRLDVKQLCGRVFVGRRQLERQFAGQFGLSPKMFIRLERFKSALRLSQTTGCNWTQIAFECGYADQAHLIREFRELSGEAPTGLLKQSHLIPVF